MNDYSDIIDLPYEGVKHHTHIPISERAAIMASFAALTGLDDEMHDTALQNEFEIANELSFEELFSQIADEDDTPL